MSDYLPEIRAGIATVTSSNDPFTLGLCSFRELAAEHAADLRTRIVEHDLRDDRALEAYDLCGQLVAYGRAF